MKLMHLILLLLLLQGGGSALPALELYAGPCCRVASILLEHKIRFSRTINRQRKFQITGTWYNCLFELRVLLIHYTPYNSQ